MTPAGPDAMHAWLVEWVARTTDVPASQIDADRPLQEVGLSSREAVALAADLSELLGRTLAPTTLWQHPSVNGIVAALFAEGSAAAHRMTVPQAGPVAVIGLGCRLPGGVESPEQFWRFLDGGGDGISDVPEGRWESFAPADSLAGLPRRGGFLDDVAGFDAAFFGITPREAMAMDPQQRMLLEVAWAALEHAGIPPASLRGSRTGVFVGMSSTEYGYLTMTDVDGIDAWSGTGAAASIAANRLSYLLDLRGPSLTLDTACSSSLVAVHQAVQSLQRGEIDTAVVAGVNLMLSPGITANFARAGVLAADGHCKPFDADADGIVRGEGCGVVVLRPLRTARKAGDRVLAVIRGSAVNSDGRSNGMMAPNPDAQASLLADAYATAGVEPSSVDYVEAHGTGTLLGDPIEAGALGGVLGAGREGDRPLLIGSVKSNLGHLEGAAGITGLIKVVLGLSHDRLPASLHYRTPNPHADLDGLGLRVVAEGTDWPRYSGAARAGVSAFGFGGTNAHVVLEEWPGAAFPPRVAPLAGPEIFALSARSDEALRERAAQLADWLDSPAGVGVPLGAVAATLAHRREHLPVRGAVVAGEREELVRALRTMDPARVTGRADVVMVFSGYGSQWPEMGRRLLATEPAFRAAVDEVEPAFRAGAGFSLRAALLGEQDLPDLGAVQLVLFGIQVALAGLWRAHGVVPAAVVGHSMGEVAAAVVAGALDVTDGLRVMAARARVLAKVDASGVGAMAVVELTADELAALDDEYPDVDVAVFGSPTQCTVTGDAAQVTALVARVEGLGRLARPLPVGGAGHSPAVEPMLPAFRTELAGIAPRTPMVRCYTTVLEDPRQASAFDVEHWAANMRRPVRFTQALAAAMEDGHTVFVEVSPHPVALAAIEQTAAGRAVALPSASRRVDERAAFLTTLAQLHVLGRPDALAARGKRTTPVELPGPVWRHETFWPARREAPAVRGSHPLLGAHLEVPGGDRHLWRGEVGTDAHPWLVDHSALGAVLFPATGFLELALAAVRSVAGGRIRIGDLELHQMLLLDGRTEVTTSLTTAGRRPAAVEVHSRTADGDWNRCATASVRTGGSPLVPLGATAGQPVDVYELLAAMGQNYGPAFRGLGSVTAADGRASATLALPEHVRDHPSYLLHPALGDACLHALAAATGDLLGGAAGLYLPLTIGEVTLAGDPRDGVRVDAVVDSVDPSGAGLLGHVQLVDADGTVLVQFRDVYCRRVQRSALPVSQASLAFEAAWRQADLPASPEGVHSWIVLRDPAGSAPPEAVRDELIAAGDEVSIADLDDPATLADLLRTGPVSGVLAFPAVGSDPDPRRAQKPVLALSAVIAVLAEIPAPPRLWVVTTGAVAVADREAGRPDGAALRGLVRVLAFEHPELRASHLDLDPAGSLRAEITADGPDDEIAWRDGVRHVRTLIRPELGEPVRETSVRDGAYVISGGLGGLGLVAATWLAERGATRLVLSGRRGAGPDDKPALDALRELGAEVQVVAGDVAEPGAAERLVAVATDGGMRLRGVLHAAGTLSDGAALTLAEDAITAVWRPKALGAWRLHEATAGHDLDWWLVYSSAAALFGSPGQAAYATANAWVDALVHWRRGHGLPAATINWGAWGEVGAAAGSRNPVLDPLGTRDAMGALDAVLRRDRAATGIARVDTDAVLELFPALAQRPFFGLFVPPSVAVSTDWAGMDVLRAAEPAMARGLLADRLVTIVAGLMGFDASEVDRHAPLTGLGLDSLMAVRARGAVERDFGLPLPVPLLLRGASLAEIADHLSGQAGFGTGDPVPAAPAVLGPRDPAERWVARHWQEQLPGSVRGVNDGFFAVGDGESAFRLRAAVSAELGREVAAADLFAVPTIAAMADLLRDEIEGLGGALMRELRPGTGRPLFLFHPAGGPTSVYQQLVGLLPDGPAVYGFERLDDEQTVEGKAARYVEMLREVQPHGPYRVGGWSFGGCLAYETARVLTEVGESVDLVVMIDTILPLAAPGREASELLLERFERFAEHIETTYGVRFAIPRAELAGLDEEDQIRLVMERLAEQVPGMGHGVLHHQYTSYLDARVAERYVPGPYDGEVLLLRAKESHQVTTTLDPRYLRGDDALGWDRLCSRLHVVRVPGDHVSMIDPSHVSVLAAELAERLLPAMTR